MAMLWQEEGYAMYDNPLYLLRQEWFHCYRWPLDAVATHFFEALPSDAIVLDYGCGTAEVCRSLWIEKQHPVCLVEPSDTCRKYLRAKYPQANVLILDDLPMTIEADTFDALICTEVFEHVLHPMGLQMELWNYLRPGGQALLSWSTAYPHAGHLEESVKQYPLWVQWLQTHATFHDVGQYVWVEKPEI